MQAPNNIVFLEINALISEQTDEDNNNNNNLDMLRKSASDWDKIKESQVKRDDHEETESQYSEFLLNKEEDRFYEETINTFEK